MLCTSRWQHQNYTAQKTAAAAVVVTALSLLHSTHSVSLNLFFLVEHTSNTWITFVLLSIHRALLAFVVVVCVGANACSSLCYEYSLFRLGLTLAECVVYFVCWERRPCVWQYTHRHKFRLNFYFWKKVDVSATLNQLATTNPFKPVLSLQHDHFVFRLFSDSIRLVCSYVCTHFEHIPLWLTSRNLN